MRYESVAVGGAARLLLGSFALLIAVGTILFSLPAATKAGGLPFVQALFMATSAVCVTGLSVLDVGRELTPFGKGVLLLLIQLGGLGLMTFSTVFFISLGRSVPYVSHAAMRETFSHKGAGDLPRLIRSVALFTLLFEAAGTAALYFLFLRSAPPAAALKRAVFHAVSAFSNAGFSLQADSFARWRSDPAMNFVLIGLIVSGGLGFIVLTELGDWGGRKVRRLFRRLAGRADYGAHSRSVLSLHARVVLAVTGLALLLGTAVFWTALGGGAAAAGGLEALFLSVTARTAGFNTVPVEGLGEAALVFLMLLMFMGASPGSTGGGVKTTTIGVLLAASWSRLWGRRSLSLFKRTVPEDTVQRAATIVLLAGPVILLFLFLILAAEAGNPALAQVPRRFLAILFETVSAFGTVGLSMGVTDRISPSGLILLSCLMFIGRLGPLTVAFAVTHAPAPIARHPEENLMVG